ncbi:hypothetical protein BD289DRAFT_179866 [Coniella lustricola]|uniref:Uncharacterized protein n=1 Tax=Coniella lustricola TaxID=2025994 RepID=A0A2T2ZTG2_9PEZI|nr:hypothetical protein BD289DRAFT_179866 [Coniella lustricola]
MLPRCLPSATACCISALGLTAKQPPSRQQHGPALNSPRLPDIANSSTFSSHAQHAQHAQLAQSVQQTATRLISGSLSVDPALRDYNLQADEPPSTPSSNTSARRPPTKHHHLLLFLLLRSSQPQRSHAATMTVVLYPILASLTHHALHRGGSDSCGPVLSRVASRQLQRPRTGS